MSEKIREFVTDQVLHIHSVQDMIIDFCFHLMREAINHDLSKFTSIEFNSFVSSRESLAASKDGQDEEYQKHLHSAGIQHHVLENKHHPEYWTKYNSEMPLIHALIMYFDWLSRCNAKGGTMADFREHNYNKLASHPGALELVKYIERVGFGTSWKK